MDAALMYTATLFVHSWLRWAVLALAVAVVVRGALGAAARRPYGDTDRATLRLLAFALTAQFVVGLLLYATSPLVRQLMADMATTMRDRTSRLIAVEHVFVMTGAVALAHLAVVLVKRGGDDRARHVRAATVTAVALALMVYGIPWAGRAVFRI